LIDMGRTALFGLMAALAFAQAASASVSPDVLKRTQGAAGAEHSSDWPCIQRKVPHLSAVSVWAGPPVDDALRHWREDSAVAATVGRLASRRVPVEEAAASVAEFARGLRPEEKAEKLTLLFAGTFESLDDDRSRLMDGIERYARAQKRMAEDIRADQARLSDLNTSGDLQQAAALNQQLLTEVRVFNERRASLTYVCEVPTLIEQRLFTLARAIQAELP
jgi:hypothetical protein